METPTTEELREKKEKFFREPTYSNAYYLADCYYRGGAINAARVYARLWAVLLAIWEMNEGGEEMYVNLLHAFGSDEDPLTWMYG